MVHTQQLNTRNQNSEGINHKHKDCLIRIAFRDKKDLLELYNAINGSDYQDPEELIVYTLEDVVFLGIKNDISFLVGEMLNLYEHQSSKNPNMPIRGLLYFARNYESYIARNGLDIHSSTLQKLPFPQYYVLYNGKEDEEDRCEIKLEDAFPEIQGVEPCLKCTATLLNINYGHNQKIMARCKTLKDYSIFIQRIRDNQDSGMGLARSVRKATEDCIDEGILRDILLKNRAEVENMVLGTWGTELHLKKVKEKEEQIEKQCEEMERQQEEMKRQQEEMKRQQAEMEKQQDEIEKQSKQMEELRRQKDAVNQLTQKLLDEGKTAELKKALMNEEYQMELLKEYGLF